MSKAILIILAIVLAVPNLVHKNINEEPSFNRLERYDPALSCLNTIDKLENYVDHCARLKNIDPHSPAYALLLAYAISCRFYHGFSHYTVNENWIAAVGEKWFGYGLACKVKPDDIMKHANAACSQQALVMMEILRRKQIDYRKVGFPHHYALEIRDNNKWYYFDPNMEPYMTLSQRDHDSWKGYNDNLKKFYDPVRHPELSYQLGEGKMAELGVINEIPAKRISIFQIITSFVSKFLWTVPVFMLVFFRRKSWSSVPLFRQQQEALPATVSA